MRSLMTAFVAAVLIAAPVTAQEAKPADSRPGVAVFPLENGGSYGSKKQDLALLRVGLQQELTTELAANTNLRVIERSALKALLDEQDLGASGRVTPETAAKIGKVVGARYVLLGSYIDNDGDFRITNRIVDVETTEIIKTSVARGKMKDMYDLVVESAGKITAGLKLPALPPAVQDARKAEAKKITPEAMVRHAMILSVQDDGNTKRAIELYNDLIKDFPDVQQFKAELEQIKPKG
jgi:TolB-like protein